MCIGTASALPPHATNEVRCVKIPDANLPAGESLLLHQSWTRAGSDHA